MAIMGWRRPFTNQNVLFFAFKNTRKNCEHREFHFNLSVATLCQHVDLLREKLVIEMFTYLLIIVSKIKTFSK